jgi:hypothetical protein
MILLMALSVFSATAVSLLVGLYRADTIRGERVHTRYVADAARAHATARVKAGAASEHAEGIILRDEAGKSCGAYGYTIIDVTVPGGPPRRRVQLAAYWPSAAAPADAWRGTLYLVKDPGWEVTCFTESRPGF